MAGFEDGASVTAAAVVAAPGIANFPVIPDWLAASLPDDRWSHTCSLVSFGMRISVNPGASTRRDAGWSWLTSAITSTSQ